MRNADDKLYRRKLNEFDQQLKKLQRELAKLKVLKREGGRARKQLVRAMQREMELTAILDEEAAVRSYEDCLKEDAKNVRYNCNKCKSYDTISVNAGNRLVIVCQGCGGRHTVEPKIAETA